MAKKAATAKAPTDAMRQALECQQNELRRLITIASESYSHLIDRLDPDVGTLVDRILTSPTKEQERMLQAWEDCARRDVQTHRAVDIARTAKTTVSTFGTACLASYAKAYMKAAEDLLATLELGGVAKEQAFAGASSPPDAHAPSQ